MDEVARSANHALWEKWTPVHAASPGYDVEAFKRGGIRLSDEEIAGVGPVAGKDLLHIQCHFGLDTLSWARLGARVTGADFSESAVALARSIAEEVGIEATFVVSSVDDLPSRLGGDFDVVYTAKGVLGWLPDIRAWAQVVSHFVRPGGIFYIFEIHPVIESFENEDVAPGELRLAYPYWEHTDPIVFPVRGTYADPSSTEEFGTGYGWNHGLGEIVTALVDAGLEIEALREYPFTEWRLDNLVEGTDGRSRLPGDLDGRLPLSFSLRATKPAR